MSTSSSQKKQDENNLKILRNLVSQEHNKRCFECRQRGPTYIDVTIYSFVCTMCSGVLRGLNPPHRVKSISMASFTPAEIDHIKSCKTGNLACQLVWLGKHDPKTDGPLPDGKDEQKLKKFLSYKYERKTWYIDPSIALKDLHDQNNSSETKPLSSLVTSKVTPLVINNFNQGETKAVARPTATSSASSISDVSHLQQETVNRTGSMSQAGFQSDPFSSSANQNNFDGFGQGSTGGNDFGNFASQPSGNTAANTGFANFSNQPSAQSAGTDFANFVSHQTNQPVNNEVASFGSQQPQNNSSVTSGAAGGRSAYDIFMQQSSGSNQKSETNSGSSTPMQQGGSSTPVSQITSNTNAAASSALSAQDRYAAISGLDNILNTETTGKDTGFSVASSNPNPFGGATSTNSSSFQGAQWQQPSQTSAFGNTAMNMNPTTSSFSSQGYGNTSTTSVFSTSNQGQLQQSSFSGQQHVASAYGGATQQSAGFNRGNVASQNTYGSQFGSSGQVSAFGTQAQSNSSSQQYGTGQQGNFQQPQTTWGSTTGTGQQWGQQQQQQQTSWGQPQQQQNIWMPSQQPSTWGQQQQPNNWQQQNTRMNWNAAQNQQPNMSSFGAVGMTAMAVNQFGKPANQSTGFPQQHVANPFTGGGGGHPGNNPFMQ